MKSVKQPFAICYVLSGIAYLICDSLRAGHSGDRISVRGRDFWHSSRPALGPTRPPVQWVPGLFPWGKTAGAWLWLPSPIQHQGQSKSRAISLLPLWAFMACFRGYFSFFYLYPHYTLIFWYENVYIYNFREIEYEYLDWFHSACQIVGLQSLMCR